MNRLKKREMIEPRYNYQLYRANTALGYEQEMFIRAKLRKELSAWETGLN